LNLVVLQIKPKTNTGRARAPAPHDSRRLP
jgi:hypothetical protein